MVSSREDASPFSRLMPRPGPRSMPLQRCDRAALHETDGEGQIHSFRTGRRRRTSILSSRIWRRFCPASDAIRTQLPSPGVVLIETLLEKELVCDSANTGVRCVGAAFVFVALAGVGCQLILNRLTKWKMLDQSARRPDGGDRVFAGPKTRPKWTSSRRQHLPNWWRPTPGADPATARNTPTPAACTRRSSTSLARPNWKANISVVLKATVARPDRVA